MEQCKIIFVITKFQELVYSELHKIPKGQVRTYSQIAESIGKPKAFRAVASACAKNPNLVTTPCHRVVRSDGGLGGYSGPGGIQTKIKLLQDEGLDLAIFLKVK